MKLSIQVKRKDDTAYYVYVSLFHNGKRALIATDYIIAAKYIKDGKITNMAKYAEVYNNEVMKYQYRINRIVAVDMLSAADVKNIITANAIDPMEMIDFFEFSRDYIESIRKIEERKGTANFYEIGFLRFKRYIGREKYYTFELTSKVVTEYMEALRKEGLKETTISNHTNTIKTLFNACKMRYNDYDLGILNIKNDPFKIVKIAKKESNAGFRALSLEDMRKIALADFSQLRDTKQTAVLERGRDLYMLSFLLLGINPTDMYRLKKTDMVDGRIEYNRKKTKRRDGGAFISVPVCDRAMALIDKYKGKKDYLLNLNERRLPLVNFAENYALKKLHAHLGLDIDIEYFTWYSARHTWASIAANDCHYSDAEVARALNHQSEHKVTRGYIRPDWSLLDRMNEAVLSVVFGE